MRIRLNASEKRTIEAAADRAGLPVASWVRSVALRAAQEQRAAKNQ
jgi:hypothetical protein